MNLSILFFSSLFILGLYSSYNPDRKLIGKYYLKKKGEDRCRSRSWIEGLISLLKHDHIMLKNYLIGTAGNQINMLLAATEYNILLLYSIRNSGCNGIGVSRR